jgi:hypothetical protein
MKAPAALLLAAAAGCAALAGPLAVAAESSLLPDLLIESRESANSAKGDVTALIDYPFATASAALRDPAQWCEVLILSLNVKYCRPSGDGDATALRLMVGSKDDTLESAYPVDFTYRVASYTAAALQVRLEAAEGPLGTSAYRIVLELAPARGGRTRVRLSYSYSQGWVTRVAMQVYLATAGRDKVGFTVVGTQPDGAPRYIAGMRGATERNTMRYYLAIEAFLATLAFPAELRSEKRFLAWFAAIERYPRQLREIGLDDYLVTKRAQRARQQAGLP